MTVVVDANTDAAAAGSGHRLRFTLPASLEARVPPEARGITRDAVRMMVAYRSDGRLVHTTFSDLPRVLDAGDLVVVNTSGTLAAAVDARSPDLNGIDDGGGGALSVHLSTRLPADLWVVELRLDGKPFGDGRPGMVLTLPGDGVVEVLAPYGGSTGRLWVASLRLPSPLLTYLAVHGRPIRYGYVGSGGARVPGGLRVADPVLLCRRAVADLLL